MLSELMQTILRQQNVRHGCELFAAQTIRRVMSPGTCENPITGGKFEMPFDDPQEQVNQAVPRLLALAHFRRSGPYGQTFPLNYAEREDLKITGDPRLIVWALFARSVDALGFDYRKHPAFEDYLKGILLSDRCRDDPRFAVLQQIYTPAPLNGLNLRTTIWRPR